MGVNKVLLFTQNSIQQDKGKMLKLHYKKNGDMLEIHWNGGGQGEMGLWQVYTQIGTSLCTGHAKLQNWFQFGKQKGPVLDWFW